MNRQFANLTQRDMMSFDDWVLSSSSIVRTELDNSEILSSSSLAAGRQHSPNILPSFHSPPRVVPVGFDYVALSERHIFQNSDKSLTQDVQKSKETKIMHPNGTLSCAESRWTERLSMFSAESVPIKCEQCSRRVDLDLSELEDSLITSNGEELPEAEMLINEVDLFTDSLKMGEEEFSESTEDYIDDEDKLSDGSTFSQESVRLVSLIDKQWTERFRELCDFKNEKGHCNVPHNYDKNPALARWVKRQRHQYKRLKIDEDQGRELPETVKARVQALRELGFVFHCQRTVWDEKFAELCEYQRQHSHCNVPSNYSANPALAMWVKSQRRQYKMLKEGRQSSMTKVRLQQLRDIGFTWELRKKNKVLD